MKLLIGKFYLGVRFKNGIHTGFCCGKSSKAKLRSMADLSAPHKGI